MLLGKSPSIVRPAVDNRALRGRFRRPLITSGSTPSSPEEPTVTYTRGRSSRVGSSGTGRDGAQSTAPRYMWLVGAPAIGHNSGRSGYRTTSPKHKVCNNDS